MLAALAVAGVAVSTFDWNMLRGSIGRQASLMAGRPIRLDGDLKVHLLSLTPGATVDDLHIGASNGISGDLARIGRLGVQIKLLPLLTGRVDLPLIDLENPEITAVRDASGRPNWRSASGGPPARLPPIQHFVIHNGHFSMVDQVRRMTLSAVVESSETQAAAGRSGAFTLQGQGQLNHDPFSLVLSGGPLLAVRRDQPYAFEASLRAGETNVLAKGVLPHPFDFGAVRAALDVEGGDLADLYYLTGVALPNTPRYRLSGEVTRLDRKYTFDRVVGQVGRSDLEGRFQVDHTSDRPAVQAELRSRTLALSDLGAVVGAPAAKGPQRSRLQRAESARLAAQDRLLPDTTLDVTRVRSTDAVVHYTADSVIANKAMPLKRVRLNLVLDHGVLTADPLAFDFPSGELLGRIRLDARGATPRDDVDLKVSNVQIEDFASRGGQAPLSGRIEARAKLSGEGASVRQAAATANGTLALVGTHGEVRRSLGELLGIDLTKGLGLMLAKDQSQMGVRCVMADFNANQGVLTARSLLLDSDTVLATGAGTVNLKDETLDLTLSGHPKRFRLVRVMAPITLQGRLRNPSVGLKPGAAPLQAGAAIVLGLLAPPAAILPFIDPGSAHDADCSAAVQEAKAKGAPVTAARH